MFIIGYKVYFPVYYKSVSTVTVMNIHKYNNKMQQGESPAVYPVGSKVLWVGYFAHCSQSCHEVGVEITPTGEKGEVRSDASFTCKSRS